jgi:hypothetical protein
VQNALIVALISGGLALTGLVLAAFFRKGAMPTKPIKRVTFILAHMVFIFAAAMFLGEESYVIAILLFVISLWFIGSIFKPIFTT